MDSCTTDMIAIPMLLEMSERACSQNYSQCRRKVLYYTRSAWY